VISLFVQASSLTMVTCGGCTAPVRALDDENLARDDELLKNGR
jgi:hypothetical protein